MSSPDVFHRRQVLSSSRDEIEQAERIILQEVERRGYGSASTFAIRLAMEEALSNAFKHGNRSDPRKTVTIESTIDERSVTIEIVDQGDGFDPDSVPDPTASENVEIPCGRGLKLMRSFMHDVSIIPPGNRVRLTYRREAAR